MSRAKSKKVEVSHGEIELAMQRFFEKGGKIEKIATVQTGFGFDRFEDILSGNDMSSETELHFPSESYSLFPPALEN